MATNIHDGCPKGFYHGSLVHPTTYFDDDKTSVTLNGNVAYGGEYNGIMDVSFGFCTKRFTAYDGVSPSWPKGSYCIYKSSEVCPEGKFSFLLYFDIQVFCKPLSLMLVMLSCLNKG